MQLGNFNSEAKGQENCTENNLSQAGGGTEDQTCMFCLRDFTCKDE